MEHVVVRLRCVGGHCGKKEKEETNGEEKKSVFIYIYENNFSLRKILYV